MKPYIPRLICVGFFHLSGYKLRFKLISMNKFRWLKERYSKNGYRFSLVERIGDVCIYRQESDGNVIVYEVFRVRKLPERLINGRKIEAREATPANEDWGKTGFSCWGMIEARKRASQLLNQAPK